MCFSYFSAYFAEQPIKTLKKMDPDQHVWCKSDAQKARNHKWGLFVHLAKKLTMKISAFKGC